jgi:hypothetical protein
MRSSQVMVETNFTEFVTLQRCTPGSDRRIREAHGAADHREAAARPVFEIEDRFALAQIRVGEDLFLRRRGIPVAMGTDPTGLGGNARGDIWQFQTVYDAIGAPRFSCGFGRARNCDVSQLTIPANELCEPPEPGDGIGYSSFSACCRSHSTLPMA